MRLLLTLLLVLLAAVPVLANPPTVGTYAALDGRFSESMNGGQGQVGNTLHAQSWDSATLGTEWILSCTSISEPPTELWDTRVGGTGEVAYRTKYLGGTYWFSKDGPWGDGTEDYPGNITVTLVTSTHLYVGGVLQSIVSDATVQGEFVNYPGCFVYTISNVEVLDYYPTPFPANYPAVLLTSCTAGGVGAWGSVTDITIVIYEGKDCTFPVEESTWGAIKSMYVE